MAAAKPLQQPITSQLEHNQQKIEERLADCQDVMIEVWHYGADLKYRALSVYCRSFIDDKHNHHLKQTLQDLVSHEVGQAETVTPQVIREFFGNHGAANQPFTLHTDLEACYHCLMNGYIVFLFDEWDQAISYKAGELTTRQVSEPISEPSVQGPREGTVENMDTNLGMLRQRIKTPDLKVKYIYSGSTMKTRIAYSYLEHTVNPDILEEFLGRLAGIEKYEVMDTSFVEDWIQDSHYSPFPQYRYTERTDTAAAALMDGKILVLVENTPMILICPALLVDFMGVSEDYSVRTVFASLIRILRIFAFVIALTLPSIYIALSTFHPELIPTVLLLTILDSREGIPFPTLYEALIMELSFELLREAGIRLPRPVGSAVSIVGALVIGQAAILAKIASPTMVIIVALTGIASFAIPHYELAIAIRILRFPFMIAASLLGGFGLMAICLVTLLHLTCLHTLGEPYLSSLAPLKLRDLRDVLVRAPLKRLLLSPRNRRLHRYGGNDSQS